ncbi:MAG: hypothetical protein K6U08_07225 [Firmicutes bacterium]|nr:hypothetical protein [Bacillota bacterium]
MKSRVVLGLVVGLTVSWVAAAGCKPEQPFIAGLDPEEFGRYVEARWGQRMTLVKQSDVWGYRAEFRYPDTEGVTVTLWLKLNPGRADRVEGFWFGVAPAEGSAVDRAELDRSGRELVLDVIGALRYDGADPDALKRCFEDFLARTEAEGVGRDGVGPGEAPSAAGEFKDLGPVRFHMFRFKDVIGLSGEVITPDEGR